MKRFKLNKGFTLIELMIVMTVMAILAAMVLFGLGQAQKRARDVQRTQLMKSVQNALQSYYADKATYPATPANFAGLFTNYAACTGAAGDGALCSYLSTALDPGCGTVPNSYDIRQYTGGVAPGFVTGCTAANPAYAYTFVAASGGTGTSGCPVSSAVNYYLSLTKESGGISYFCGPQ